MFTLKARGGFCCSFLPMAVVCPQDGEEEGEYMSHSPWASALSLLGMAHALA